MRVRYAPGLLKNETFVVIEAWTRAVFVELGLTVLELLILVILVMTKYPRSSY